MPCGFDETLVLSRLRLKRVDPDGDLTAYAAWMNDPDVVRFTESRYSAHSLDQIRAYVARCNDDPSLGLFGLFLKDTDRHVGNIKLGPVNGRHRRADIGLIVGDPSLWGYGYASEAIRGLSDWAIAKLGLFKLTAGCYRANEGSRRAFEKAGFEIEAVRGSHFFIDGSWSDEYLMARFAPDQRRSRATAPPSSAK